MSFPIDRVNERQYAADYDGLVVTCDIDRTYLATRFSSLKGIARIPFEFGIDKSDIAGMARLLREVRRGPGEVSAHTPLYFVSASPAQLRPVIHKKMLLDGLEYDGTTFKNWIKVLLSRRTARFKEQVGYKVTALLMGRAELPSRSREILIGDDLETDALAFCCYADLLAGRIPPERAAAVLEGLGVAADDAAHAASLRQSFSCEAGVERVYIRLERHTPDAFRDFAPGLRACVGAFQMALGMADDGCISVEGVARVAADLKARGTTESDLADRLGDAVDRSLITPSGAQRVVDTLAAHGVRLVVALPEPSWPREHVRGTCWLPQRHRG